MKKLMQPQIPQKKAASLVTEGSFIRNRSKLPSTSRTEVKSNVNASLHSFVGIGASAGGLEAIIELLEHVPAKTGMVYLVVQHLAPDHESILPQILSRHTSIPVMEAKHNVAVLADHVYVIGPGVSMHMKDGKLKLAPRVKVGGRLRCVDKLFQSLATNYGSHAIGVVLSGTEFDGTAGLRAIKAEGGITFAQDELTAKFVSMPRSAVASGCVDQVFSPADIGRALAHLSVSFGEQAHVGDEPTILEKGDISPIVQILRDAKGVDFNLYKPTTFKRRIIRRAVINRKSSIPDYVTFLQEHPKEIDALYEDVLINVTAFFRDPEVFDVLKKSVFPKLVANRSPDEPVRIWVAGCSTGQEVYSLAMAFLEFTSSVESQVPLQIFGTDLNESVLEKARSGLFTADQIQDLSKERLRRFFIKADGVYQVCKPIREMCIFARHNVINDPPFSRMDLVSCRNMLIYFETSLQKRVIPVFHYALKPHGFLLLGNSETVGEHADLFSADNKTQRIYTKKATTLRSPLYLPNRQTGLFTTLRAPVLPAPSIENEAQREADRLILAKYSPPGVVVNAGLEIIQFRGSTSRYLEPMPGKASFHVLKMAREGLLLPLRSALHQAKRDGLAVRKDDVTVHIDGRAEKLNLDIVPLKNLKEVCYLILFESPSTGLHPEERRLLREDRVRKRAGNKQDAAAEILRLQSELASVKEYLQSVSEQHEAANEELQAGNEEAQSSNEELQSINEELETTKEELESTNEELRSVNDEMNQRNQELHRINSDLHNVLNSVQMCVVVLDNDLCIRRFTPLAEKVLNLVPTDAGRPITNIKPNISFPQLESFIITAIDQMNTQQTEVQDKEDRWFSLRVMPYRTLENKIDGAVLVLTDIDGFKRSEERIQAALDYAQSTLETVREPLVVLSADLCVESVNRSFCATFGLTAAETIGCFIYDLNDGRWNIPALRVLLQEILPQKVSFEDYAMDFQMKNLGVRHLLLNARQVGGASGKTSKILLAIEDATERTDQRQDTLEQLETFSYSVSHDLRAPLRSIMNFAEIIRENCTGSLDETNAGYLNRIIVASMRMDRLITDVLLYSRTAQSTFSLEPVDLNLLVKDAVHDLALPPTNKPQIQVQGVLPAVMAHEASLMQCILNLLSNAVKFVAPDRPAQITIFAEPAGNEVRLIIEDNGIGIAKEHHEQIFNLFERLNAGNRFEGTGIGLAIIRKVMSRMGGQVGVISELNKGSRFWIQLARVV